MAQAEKIRQEVSAFTRSQATVKTDKQKTLKPVPATSTGVIGWLAQRLAHIITLTFIIFLSSYAVSLLSKSLLHIFRLTFCSYKNDLPTFLILIQL